MVKFYDCVNALTDSLLYSEESLSHTWDVEKTELWIFNLEQVFKKTNIGENNIGK